MRVLASFFIIGLIFLVIFLLKYMGRYWYYNKIKWLLGSYLAILVIGFLAFQIIPIESFPDREIIGSGSIDRLERVQSSFYNAARQGRLDQVEGVLVKGQWNFAYKENRLEIVKLDDSSALIIIERKEAVDENIKVVEYTTKSMIGGIDVTGKIKPFEVNLQDNRLIIARPEPYRVECTTFKSEFTVNQFRKENVDQGDNLMKNSFWGLRIIYLRIPENIQIEAINQLIEFVDL